MEALIRSDTKHGTRALAADHRAMVGQHRTPVIQVCSSCHGAYFPPRLRCSRCGSEDLDWQPTSGLGTVATWVTVHRPEETPSMSIPNHLKPLAPFSTVFVGLAGWPLVRVAALHFGQEAGGDLTVGLEVEVKLAQVAGSEALVCRSVVSGAPGKADRV